MAKRVVMAVLLGAAFVALGLAQAPVNAGPGGPPSLWDRPWWNSRLVGDLNLTEAQQSDLRAAVREYRGRIVDIRAAMQKADGEVESAFAENPVDQRKAGEAIERLSAARGDLTRTLSQMSLKLRTILTAEQWQELQRRQPRGARGGDGPFGRGRRGGGGAFGSPPPTGFAK